MDQVLYLAVIGACKNDNDVPTLPEWGTILLGGLLMLQAMRAQRRQQGKPGDRS